MKNGVRELCCGWDAFTGPDSIQYRWALGAMGTNYPKVSLLSPSPGSPTLNHDMKLVTTTDEKKTVIAEFHRVHYFTKKRKARLDLKPNHRTYGTHGGVTTVS